MKTADAADAVASDAVEVMVIGESIVDIMVDEATGSEEEHVGGSPANVAVGVARLGRNVTLCTALANDARGDFVAAHLVSSGVNIDPNSWTLMKTSTARAVLAADRSATYTFQVEWPRRIFPFSGTERLLHVGSIAATYWPGAHDVLAAVEQSAGHRLICFDPNIRPALAGAHPQALQQVEAVASMSDVVKLSDEDAGWLYPDREPDGVLDRLLALGARVVVVTRGAAGSRIASRHARVDIDAPKVRVQDTVGAGDSYSSALIDAVLGSPSILADATEAELSRLGRYAATAAAVTVQRVGANPPTRADLSQCYRE
jgi:fructokinase